MGLLEFCKAVSWRCRTDSLENLLFVKFQDMVQVQNLRILEGEVFGLEESDGESWLGEDQLQVLLRRPTETFK